MSSLFLTPEAEEEITEAFEWYGQRVAGLGTQFMASLESALASIAEAPLRYPCWRQRARRILLRRFPYAVFYTIKPEGIVVFACFHGKRNPKVLIGRLRGAHAT
jgi:plasmid stabilization system protein ParE